MRFEFRDVLSYGELEYLKVEFCMSIPEGTEYWWAVKEARFQSITRPEPKMHALVPEAHFPLHPRTAYKTLCGIEMIGDRIRSKKSKVTCANCLALLRRYVVTLYDGSFHKNLFASDDRMAVEEYARDNQGMVIVDNQTGERFKSSLGAPPEPMVAEARCSRCGHPYHNHKHRGGPCYFGEKNGKRGCACSVFLKDRP